MEILVSTMAKLMKNNMEIGKNIEIQWEEEKKKTLQRQPIISFYHFISMQRPAMMLAVRDTEINKTALSLKKLKALRH